MDSLVVNCNVLGLHPRALVTSLGHISYRLRNSYINHILQHLFNGSNALEIASDSLFLSNITGTRHLHTHVHVYIYKYYVNFIVVVCLFFFQFWFRKMYCLDMYTLGRSYIQYCTVGLRQLYWNNL